MHGGDCIRVCNDCSSCREEREPQPATGTGSDASNATSKQIRKPRRAEARPTCRHATRAPRLKKGLADKSSALGRDPLRLLPLVNASCDPPAQTSPAPNAEKAAPSAGGGTTLPWPGPRESEGPRVENGRARPATTFSKCPVPDLLVVPSQLGSPVDMASAAKLAFGGRDSPMDTECHGSTRPVTSTPNSRPPAGTPQPQSPSIGTSQAQPSPSPSPKHVIKAKKCGIPFYLEDGVWKSPPPRVWLRHDAWLRYYTPEMEEVEETR